MLVGGEPFEYPHPGWDAVVPVTTSSVKQADSGLVATALTAFARSDTQIIATYPAGVPAGIAVRPTPR